jgi:hypothetical protein
MHAMPVEQIIASLAEACQEFGSLYNLMTGFSSRTLAELQRLQHTDSGLTSKMVAMVAFDTMAEMFRRMRTPPMTWK